MGGIVEEGEGKGGRLADDQPSGWGGGRSGGGEGKKGFTERVFSGRMGGNG